MTYTALARVFEDAVARGSTTVDALQLVDKARVEWHLRQRHRSEPLPSLPSLAKQALEETAAEYSMTVEEVCAAGMKRAKGPAIRARRCAALVMCVWGELSHRTIAKALGRTNHTTAIGILERAKTDSTALAAAERIARRLGLIETKEAA